MGPGQDSCWGQGDRNQDEVPAGDGNKVMGTVMG